MSFQAMAWAMAQNLSPVDKLSLIYLADGYHPSQAPNVLNRKRLAAFCGISDEDTYGVMAALEDEGLLTMRGDQFWLCLPEHPPVSVVKEDPPAFLYVLSCDGLVKIGITKNLASRVSSIQTSNPSPVALLHHRQAPLSVVRAWERLCHDELAGHHRSGEWFAVDQRDAIALVDRMEFVDV